MNTSMQARADDVLRRFRDHPRLTPARWDNLVRAVDDYLNARATTTAVPYSLFVEASSACNLSCPLCPNGAGTLGRPAENLSLDVFTRLVEELSDRILEVHFAFFGEPMVNPRLERMVEIAHRADLETRLMTNALLISPARAQALVAAGLDRVTISADSFEQVAYEAYRVGGDADRMAAGIGNLVRGRSEQGSQTPLIEVQFLALRSTEAHLDDSIARAWALGADRVKIKKVSLDSVELGEQELRAFLPENDELRYYDLETLQPRREKAHHQTCPSLYLAPGIIMSNGRTALCCRDAAGAHSYGDPREQGFEPVWHGPVLNEIRRSFPEEAARPSMCSGCGILEELSFQAVVLDRQAHDDDRP